MDGSDRMLKVVLLIIALLLGMIVARPYLVPEMAVAADSGRFDYLSVVSAVYIYNGRPGVLLLDKRNGNVWFLGKQTSGNMKSSFGDPEFVAHVPLEKVDEAVR
jgi:hypothetical protein